MYKNIFILNGILHKNVNLFNPFLPIFVTWISVNTLFVIHDNFDFHFRKCDKLQFYFIYFGSFIWRLISNCLPNLFLVHQSYVCGLIENQKFIHQSIIKFHLRFLNNSLDFTADTTYTLQVITILPVKYV